MPFILSRAAGGRLNSMFGCAGLVALFTVWRGQMAPRYPLEPYLWCVAAAAGSFSFTEASNVGKLRSIFPVVLTAQTLGVAVAALAGAVFLFPGALTPGLRQATMRRFTFGYEEARWAASVLPAEVAPDSLMMSESRAYALYPRPFAIPDCAACTTKPLLSLFRREDGLNRHVGVLVLGYPVAGKVAEGCVTATIAGPREFRYATRSPFNFGAYSAIALRVECR